MGATPAGDRVANRSQRLAIASDRSIVPVRWASMIGYASKRSNQPSSTSATIRRPICWSRTRSQSLSPSMRSAVGAVAVAALRAAGGSRASVTSTARSAPEAQVHATLALAAAAAIEDRPGEERHWLDIAGRLDIETAGTDVKVLFPVVLDARAREGTLAGQHLHGDHTQRIDVRGDGGSLGTPLLRSRIRRRHRELPGIWRGGGFGVARDPEVLTGPSRAALSGWSGICARACGTTCRIIPARRVPFMR
jgi:hypothetical protein